jgi:hypothetical protein
MASKRRGGFGPEELRGTLGTLLRTTTGVFRSALARGAREGRARLDDVRTSRRRQDALAELGELVLDLIRRGEIDLAELPEARELVHQLDEFDAEAGEAPEPEPPRALSRSRFDDRAARDAPGLRHGVAARDPAATRDPAADDGTVSSSVPRRSARPTTPARPKQSDATPVQIPVRPSSHTWRPDVPDDVPTLDGMPAARRSASPLPPGPLQRKGGISFDDDDLNEYMHPDDVPPKGPPRDPGDDDA